MVLKIIFLLLLVVLFLGIIFLIIKMYQLKKLEKMNSSDIIDYIIQNDDKIKISIAIMKDGEVTYHIYGKNGKRLDDTKYDYEIGSISKTFVGLMLSKAIEDNKINLNSSISEYLPLDKDKYYPTIERLITHTSGYKSYYFNKQMIRNYFHQNNDFYGINKKDILNKVKNIALENMDYKFNYSNFGIAVIGLVLEQVYGENFITLMNDFIENDLSLKHTKVATCTGNLDGYWNWKEDDGYIPAGAIISNIEEMVQYLTYYRNNEDLYISNTYAELKSINANNSIYEKMNIRMDKIGMTWMIDEKNNIFWHNGGTSNYNSYIAFNKDKKIGIVALGNISPIKKVPMTVIGAKLMTELEYKIGGKRI